MKKIKQFFIDARKNMPRHTQWVLLGIAIVLTIMIILLLTDNKKTPQKKTGGKSPGETTMAAKPGEIVFGNEPREEKITLSASAPLVVSEIELSPDVPPGLSLQQPCTTRGPITSQLPCEAILTWKPDGQSEDWKRVLNIKYYDANGSKDMENLEIVNISFSSSKKKTEIKKQADDIPEIVADESIAVANEPVAETIEPFIEEEPASEPEPKPEPESEPEPEPKPIKEEKQAPPPKKTPVVLDEPKADNYVAAAEECYQFAFAGYNNSGKQIGWIKPSGGHYMFHPFSDTTCSEPTGEYNPKTGFITALDNPSKRIGSDAEHIGGRGAGANLTMPTLSNPTPKKELSRAAPADGVLPSESGSAIVFVKKPPMSSQKPSSYKDQATISSVPYDRTFVLRHFKPIPATIVNEIRAVENYSILPVMATVDRHVYSDNGRTVVIPAGTLMLGNVKGGDLPGPYKTIGRIEIEWYRFIRPDGVEFNFTGERPFSGDSQGRIGVPGYGSSDYLEQMVMPLLTAIVPAATNLIAPIADKVVNQIDLDNNVVVQTGTMRSSELAKQELIQSWNKVTEKLFIDMLDNTKPPFSIASGTRITVYSPTDLIVAWCDDAGKCTPDEVTPSPDYAKAEMSQYSVGVKEPETHIGQVSAYVSGDESKIKDERMNQLMKGFRQYQSKSMAANEVYQAQVSNAGGVMKDDGTVLKQGTKEYNKEVLGLQYKKDADGNETELIINPNASIPKPKSEIVDEGLTCDGGMPPDGNGCCPGETFTDMGEEGWNCCPDAGGDCFPPLEI